MVTNATKYILIAEDDEDDQFIIAAALKRIAFPWQVRFVASGLHAIEFLEKQAALLPEVILLDLNMPRLDGCKTLEYLKRVPALKDIPVYILSTSRSPYDFNRCIGAGAIDYFIKPNEFDALQLLLTELLKRHL